MDGYDAATYGDRIADVYDDLYPPGPGVEDAVALLADLAASGAVLELGVGTGRLALPLAARSVNVKGVDASATIVEKLRAKPGGERLEVRLADFGRDPLGADFALCSSLSTRFSRWPTSRRKSPASPTWPPRWRPAADS